MRFLKRGLALLAFAAVAACAAVSVSAPADAAPASSAYGCDYSYSRPSIYTLDHPNVGSGVWCRFVTRYLYSAGKGLTASEARTLHANGRDLVLNWEGTGHEVTGGYSAGVVDARQAAAYRAAVGAPTNVPVIFSVDFDERNLSQVVSWLNGAASVLGKDDVGVYGSYRVVNAACSAGYRFNWQTYAWSGGKWASPGCAPLRQVRNGIVGGSLDLDLQVGAYPFWGPNSPVVVLPVAAPRATPVATPKRHTVVRHPARPRTVYVTVRRGDTLSGIASRRHTSWRHLAALNHLRNPNRVYAGQRLRLR